MIYLFFFFLWFCEIWQIWLRFWVCNSPGSRSLGSVYFPQSMYEYVQRRNNVMQCIRCKHQSSSSAAHLLAGGPWEHCCCLPVCCSYCWLCFHQAVTYTQESQLQPNSIQELIVTIQENHLDNYSVPHRGTR